MHTKVGITSGVVVLVGTSAVGVTGSSGVEDDKTAMDVADGISVGVGCGTVVTTVVGEEMTSVGSGGDDVGVIPVTQPIKAQTAPNQRSWTNRQAFFSSTRKPVTRTRIPHLDFSSLLTAFGT